MSRIGKQPIPIPDKVQVHIDGSDVTVKGPKGELHHSFPVDITIAQEKNEIVVTRPTDNRQHRALHGMTLRSDCQYGIGREHRLSAQPGD